MKTINSFKENKVENLQIIIGGRRERDYYDVDGDGHWDLKIVRVYRGNRLIKMIFKYRP